MRGRGKKKANESVVPILTSDPSNYSAPGTTSPSRTPWKRIDAFAPVCGKDAILLPTLFVTALRCSLLCLVLADLRTVVPTGITCVSYYDLHTASDRWQRADRKY